MSLIGAFSKLCVSGAIRTIEKCSQQSIHTTAIMCAEPIRKKKRADPKLEVARTQRKKRKVEKQIRRLQKNARQFKPIDEIELPVSLRRVEDRALRTRAPIQMTEAELDYRYDLEKRWAQYKLQERLELNATCARILTSQAKALEALRQESEILYQAAIQPMDAMVPLTVEGPVYTAPIKDYFSPAKYRSIEQIAFFVGDIDGDYKNVTRVWE